MNSISRRTLLGSAAAIGVLGAAGTRLARAAGTIKLGASISLTGRFSDSAKYVEQGYRLWEEETNAAGGINGNKVKIIIYDDESNPDTGRVLAQRLIDKDGVLAILGPYSSPITDAEAVVVERAHVPMIATIASDSGIWSRRHLTWSFQAFPSSDYDHEGFIKAVKAKGSDLKKIAIIFEQNPFSIAAKDWAVPFAEKLGFAVEAYGYAPGGQDFRSIIERIIKFGAHAVSMGGYYQPSIALTRQMIERGYNPAGYQFITSSDGVTKDGLGANAEGIFGRTAWEAAVDTPMNNAFVAAFTKKHGQAPSYHAATAYAGGQVFAAAIKAKGTDQKGIRDFIASNTVETVMGTFKVNDKGQQEGYRYLLTQWQGGTPKLVGGNFKTPIEWPKPAWK